MVSVYKTLILEWVEGYEISHNEMKSHSIWPIWKPFSTNSRKDAFELIQDCSDV